MKTFMIALIVGLMLTDGFDGWERWFCVRGTRRALRRRGRSWRRLKGAIRTWRGWERRKQTIREGILAGAGLATLPEENGFKSEVFR